MHRSKLTRLAGIIYVCITAAGFSSGIKADCIQSRPFPAAFVAVIDATTACSAITGQFGCSIDSFPGECTAYDSSNTAAFTVDAAIVDDEVSWEIREGSSIKKVDSALVGGATQGNACAYSYQFDVAAGTGGFLKSNGSNSRIPFVDICSDGIDQVAPPLPPPSTEIKQCPTVLPGSTLPNIDSTGIQCPSNAMQSSIVCNFELTDDNGPVPFFGLTDNDSCCVCNAPAALQECDPGLPEGMPAEPGMPGPCPVDPVLRIPHTEVTTFIEFNNDPYFCRTIAGRRTCYYY